MNKQNINEGEHSFKVIEDYFGDAAFGKKVKVFILKCDCCGQMITKTIQLPKNAVEATIGSRKKLMLNNKKLRAKLNERREI